MRRGHTITETERLMREGEGTPTPTMTPSGSFDEWGQSPPDSRRSSFGNDLTDVALGSSSARSRVDFLELPTVEDIGAMELAPHKQDAVERIPMRARSQSWLIRTRHLLHEQRVSQSSSHPLPLPIIVCFPDAGASHLQHPARPLSALYDTDLPFLSVLLLQSRKGVRARRHLPSWSADPGGDEGTGAVLRYALRRHDENGE